MSTHSSPVIGRLLTGKITIPELLLFVFPFLFIYQNPELREYFDIKPGPKIYHYFLPFFFAAFTFRSAPRKLRPIGILVGVVVVNLLLTRHFSQELANFILFTLTCICASAVSPEEDRWFRAGCWVAICAICTNMLLHLPEIMTSGANNAEDRAIYPTLLAAGVNIELSTLVLLLVYVAAEWFLPLTVIVFLLYAVFGTRAVLVVWCLYVGLAYAGSIKRLLQRHWFKLLAGVMLIGGGVVLVMGDNLQFTFLDRVLAIGTDPGSIGRLMLYQVAFSATDCFALGCGLGSAHELISNTRIANFFEDNFHNVYLQLMVEVGIPGLLAYVAVYWTAARNSIRQRDRGLYVCIVGLAALSCIQFTGYEIITAYFLGRALHGSAKNGSVDHHVHAQRQPVHGKSV